MVSLAPGIKVLILVFQKLLIPSFSFVLEPHPSLIRAVARGGGSQESFFHCSKGIGRSMSLSSNNEDDSVSSKPPNHVVIAGAGVVGCCSAFYLAKEFGVASTLVDPTGTIAPAASGKAGGFLALDWNDYAPVGPLARRSFQLHQEIADTLGSDKLQYRRLTCAAISVGSTTTNHPKGKKLEGIEWAEGDGLLGSRSLGDESTIAQVHPKKLCEALWEETQKLAPSSKLVQGKIQQPVYDNDNKELIGARLQDSEEVIPGDALLYACGPWTCNQMTGIKYHSVVVPTQTTLSQCVFFSGCGDPEVYVRPDQTAYCTGFPDAPVRVTEEPGQEEVRADAITKIETAVQQASNLKPLSSSLKQACYLPSTPDGLPLMGALPNQPGCFVAAGHSCWGILMGPATGESMAQLLCTGKSPHVDLRNFDPARIGIMKMVPSSS